MINLIPFGSQWTITGSTNEFTAISDADDTTFVNSPDLLSNSNEVSPGNRHNFLGASITYPTFNFKNPKVAVRVRDANSMINLIITCNLVWYLTPVASTITNLTPYSAEDPNLYKMTTSTQITPDNFNDLIFDFSSQNNDIPLLTDIDNSSPYGKSFWIEISAFNPNLGTFGIGISKLCFNIDENEDLPPGTINDVFEVTPNPPPVFSQNYWTDRRDSYIELYAMGYDEYPPSENITAFPTISQQADLPPAYIQVGTLIPIGPPSPSSPPPPPPPPLVVEYIIPTGVPTNWVGTFEDQGPFFEIDSPQPPNLPTLPGFNEPRLGLNTPLGNHDYYAGDIIDGSGINLNINYDGNTINIIQDSNYIRAYNSGMWHRATFNPFLPTLENASIGYFDLYSTRTGGNLDVRGQPSLATIGGIRNLTIRPYTTFSVPLTTVSPTKKEFLNESVFYKISCEINISEQAYDTFPDPIFGEKNITLTDFEVQHYNPTSMIPIPPLNSIEFDSLYNGNVITLPISWRIKLNTRSNSLIYADTPEEPVYFYFTGKIILREFT